MKDLRDVLTERKAEKLFEIGTEGLNKLNEAGVVWFYRDMCAVSVWLDSHGVYYLWISYFGEDECRGGEFIMPCPFEMVKMIQELEGK